MYKALLYDPSVFQKEVQSPEVQKLLYSLHDEWTEYCKYSFGLDQDGEYTNNPHFAIAWCAVGWLRHVAGEMDYYYDPDDREVCVARWSLEIAYEKLTGVHSTLETINDVHGHAYVRRLAAQVLGIYE